MESAGSSHSFGEKHADTRKFKQLQDENDSLRAKLATTSSSSFLVEAQLENRCATLDSQLEIAQAEVKHLLTQLNLHDFSMTDQNGSESSKPWSASSVDQNISIISAESKPRDALSHSFLSHHNSALLFQEPDLQANNHEPNTRSAHQSLFSSPSLRLRAAEITSKALANQTLPSRLFEPSSSTSQPANRIRQETEKVLLEHELLGYQSKLDLADSRQVEVLNQLQQVQLQLKQAHEYEEDLKLKFAHEIDCVKKEYSEKLFAVQNRVNMVSSQLRDVVGIRQELLQKTEECIELKAELEATKSNQEYGDLLELVEAQQQMIIRMKEEMSTLRERCRK